MKQELNIELVRAVLQLPEAQRLGLIDLLVQSLERTDNEIGETPVDPSNPSWPCASEEIKLAWDAEIERRITEFEAGKVKSIPAEQVMAEIREKLREHAES